MNIYKLTTNADTDSYDYYDSAIVVASNEDEARSVHPSARPDIKVIDGKWFLVFQSGHKYLETSWAISPDLVNAELIGVADSKYDKPQVICASFNAG